MMYAGYSRTDSKILAKTRADVFCLLYDQISNRDLSSTEFFKILGGVFP